MITFTTLNHNQSTSSFTIMKSSIHMITIQSKFSMLKLKPKYQMLANNLLKAKKWTTIKRWKSDQHLKWWNLLDLKWSINNFTVKSSILQPKIIENLKTSWTTPILMKKNGKSMLKLQSTNLNKIKTWIVRKLKNMKKSKRLSRNTFSIIISLNKSWIWRIKQWLSAWMESFPKYVRNILQNLIR